MKSKMKLHKGKNHWSKKMSIRTGVLAAGLLTHMLASDPAIFADDRPFFQGDSMAYLQNYFGIQNASALGASTSHDSGKPALFEGSDYESTGYFSISGSEGGGEGGIAALHDMTAVPLYQGYAVSEPEAQVFTITPSGATLTNVRLELSGEKDSFNISPLSETVTTSTYLSFTAKEGLSAGNHTVTFSVYADNMQPVGPYSVTQSVYAADYSLSYAITQTTSPITEGYASDTQGSTLISLTRTGNSRLTNLSASLSGPQAGSFTLTQPVPTELNKSVTSTNMSVKLNDGLTAGDYSVSVSVYANYLPQPVSFTITQSVYARSSIVTTPGGSTPLPSPNPDAIVLVNGKPESVGTLTTTTAGNRVTSMIDLDPKKLEERLNAVGNGAIITIPITGSADNAIGQLNGQMVSNMERKRAVLELKTDQATYTLPADQINILALSQKLGAGSSLQDIKVRIEVSKPVSATVQVVESSAAKGESSIVVPPLEFTVKAAYKDQVVEVTQFQAYVERTIAVPDGVDPNKITTGIVVDPDGTVRHVPTKVIVIDGKYYVKVNSLTNSTYTVVWHPLAFTDVAQHWAKNAVNDMGSRMVLNGVTDKLFQPDQAVTRAEFAAMLVRALGVKAVDGGHPYRDVNSGVWYNAYVSTAAAYKIISGISDEAFGPDQKLTREQAMVMIANAMRITGLDLQLPKPNEIELLKPFEDRASIADWAKSSVLLNLQAGLVSGRTDTVLAPQALMTRAEVATIVERLLQKSSLI